VITPTLRGFAQATVTWTAQNRTKKGFGPYTILWEESEAKAAGGFLGKIALQDVNDIPSVVALLTAAGDFRATRDATDWMDTQRRARAKVTFSKDEIEKAIELGFAQRRRARKNDGGGWRGMTVHGAKNREFDNVVVLWPAAIGGRSDDHKRRLLYNAVTRAKQRCLVLVQAKASLGQAPFA
jgi:superfamily I DNA/RNA helicase